MGRFPSSVHIPSQQQEAKLHFGQTLNWENTEPCYEDLPALCNLLPKLLAQHRLQLVKRRAQRIFLNSPVGFLCVKWAQGRLRRGTHPMATLPHLSNGRAHGTKGL